MSDIESRTNATPAAHAPAAWLRPTLVALPPLRDLTLQSGTSAVTAGAGFSAGDVGFTP